LVEADGLNLLFLFEVEAIQDPLIGLLRHHRQFNISLPWTNFAIS
jgi:hypothetical protein